MWLDTSSAAAAAWRSPAEEPPSPLDPAYFAGPPTVGRYVAGAHGRTASEWSNASSPAAATGAGSVASGAGAAWPQPSHRRTVSAASGGAASYHNPAASGRGAAAAAACKYFASGGCAMGDACPYSHDLTVQASTRGEAHAGFVLVTKVANLVLANGGDGASSPDDSPDRGDGSRFDFAYGGGFRSGTTSAHRSPLTTDAYAPSFVVSEGEFTVSDGGAAAHGGSGGLNPAARTYQPTSIAAMYAAAAAGVPTEPVAAPVTRQQFDRAPPPMPTTRRWATPAAAAAAAAASSAAIALPPATSAAGTPAAGSGAGTPRTPGTPPSAAAAPYYPTAATVRASLAPPLPPAAATAAAAVEAGAASPVPSARPTPTTSLAGRATVAPGVPAAAPALPETPSKATLPSWQLAAAALAQATPPSFSTRRRAVPDAPAATAALASAAVAGAAAAPVDYHTAQCQPHGYDTAAALRQQALRPPLPDPSQRPRPGAAAATAAPLVLAPGSVARVATPPAEVAEPTSRRFVAAPVVVSAVGASGLAVASTRLPSERPRPPLQSVTQAATERSLSPKEPSPPSISAGFAVVGVENHARRGEAW